MGWTPSREWRAPPGWPAAPAGWAPPPGWLRPPEWPEPPRGWRFWRLTRAGRHRLAIGIPILLVIGGGLIAAAIAYGQAGTPGVTSSEGSGCWDSGGPDWLFGALLVGGAGTLISAAVWGTLLHQSGRAFVPQQRSEHAPRQSWLLGGTSVSPGVRKLLGWAWRVLLFALVLFNLNQLRSGDDLLPIVAFCLAVVAVSAIPLVVQGLATRRAKVDGVWPNRWHLPAGATWWLPVFFLASLGSAVGSLVASIALGHSC